MVQLEHPQSRSEGGEDGQHLEVGGELQWTDGSVDMKNAIHDELNNERSGAGRTAGTGYEYYFMITLAS